MHAPSTNTNTNTHTQNLQHLLGDPYNPRRTVKLLINKLAFYISYTMSICMTKDETEARVQVNDLVAEWRSLVEVS